MRSDRLSRALERCCSHRLAPIRLRELVFELAVRGALVDQRPGETPALALLGERRLPSTPDQDPPRGWEVTSLRLLGDVVGGGTPNKGRPEYWTGPIPWVTPKDMKVDYIGDAIDHISPEAVEGSAAKIIPPGSVLMVVRGMILGHSFPTALTTAAVTINQDMKAVVPFDERLGRYLLLVTKGLKREILSHVKRSTHGTGRLASSDLLDLPIPLPPFEEQQRILTRVDELSACCDELDAALGQRDATRDRLRASSLARLTAPAEMPGELDPKDVTFFLSHSERMLTNAAHVADLRRTIIDLAVQGKLAVSHEAPRVQALDDLCDKITDGTHRTPTYVSSGVHFVSVKDFSAGRLDLSRTRFITAEEHEELVKRCDPRRGDVLIGRIGTLGKAVVVDTDTPFSLFVSAGLLRPRTELCLPEYLSLYLNSPSAERQYEQIKVGGGTHTNKLNLGDLKRLEMPVPALVIQTATLAKVDELMAICDEFEQALRSAEETRAKLLETVLNEALNGRGVGAELAEAAA